MRTAQQLSKHWCDISAVLAASAEHSTVWAVVGKENSIPTDPVHHQYNCMLCSSSNNKLQCCILEGKMTGLCGITI